MIPSSSFTQKGFNNCDVMFTDYLHYSQINLRHKIIDIVIYYLSTMIAMITKVRVVMIIIFKINLICGL